jgi:hypothetical protein
MIKRTLWMGAATSALFGLAASNASAGIYDPTSESINTPKISAPHDELAAALYIHNVITVLSEDQVYTKAQPTKLGLPFHVDVTTTANKWRIKESYITYSVAPIFSGDVMNTCCGSLGGFAPMNYAALVGYTNTEHVNTDAWWTVDVDDNNLGTAARNACRELEKGLRKRGTTGDEIFSQDRSTSMPREFRFVARVGHRNPNHDVHENGGTSTYWKQSQPYWTNIEVLCQRDMTSNAGFKPVPTPPPSASDDIAAAFQVNQAALAITPKHYEAKCPAKLHLNPTIEATGKGTVKYRFVDQLGNKSQEFQVKFDKHDVKFLDHVIELDGKGKPKGLGLAAAQPQSDGLGLSANTKPNLSQGYFQVEVTSPHHKLSNIADYSIKCTVQTAGDGEMTAPKDTVNPVIVGGLAAGLPDLVIDGVQPSPAVPTKLFVKITNKGIGASKPTNLKAIRWTGNQSRVRGTLVPAIQAGQSQVVLAELGGTIDGATQLYVRVDDPNRIPEKDESNNSFKVK